MMKVLLCLFALVGANTMLNGQELVSTEKTNRTVVLEEYTGVRCGYCPEGHAIARNIKSSKPKGSVLLINIHEGPYANPMDGYPDYTTEFGTGLRELAIISGYPSGTVNRHKFDPNATSTALSRTAWEGAADDILKLASPVNTGVRSSFNSETRELTVDVEAYYTDAVKEVKNYLHVVLKESKIIGIQIDYTNGTQNNYSHDNMLRHMLTGLWGDTINSPKTGRLVKKQYKYIVPENIQIENCDVAAFISQSKQEIYSGAEVKANGGQTVVLGTLKTNDRLILSGVTEQKTNFSFAFRNTLKEKSSFIVELLKTQPSDWKSDINVNGTTTETVSTIELDPDQEISFSASITPGASAAVGQYAVKITSEKYPEAFELRKEMYVLANADELLISHADAMKFEQSYKTSLTNSGSTKLASTKAEVFSDLFVNDALEGVKNIFYNVSWSFPAMSDNNALTLQNAIDEGKNLFIAGQDIAWDIGSNDSRAHGTNVTKGFLRDYLNVMFLADGDSTYTQMSMYADDPIFGQLGKSNIIDVHNKNLYPEVIKPLNGAYPIFQYEGEHEGVIGGLRHDFKKGKIVYLGIGIEQIENKELADKIIKTSRDWFAGVLSVDDKNENSFVVSPNPAQHTITIKTPINALVNIYDCFGTLVYSDATTSESTTISTNNFLSGTYLITLRNGSEKVKNCKLQIIH